MLSQNKPLLDHKYFVVAKHVFYLEDAVDAFGKLGIKIRTSDNLDELVDEILQNPGRTTVFFPHYSKIVDVRKFPNTRLIGFHTGSLPHDRGGSPVQNKILRKEYLTNVSAIDLDESVDSGAIYTTREIDLSRGSIETILKEISRLISAMMIEIVTGELISQPQVGIGTHRKRLEFLNSQLPEIAELDELFDRIRMVDGLDYPSAFIKLGNYKISFREAKFLGDSVSAIAFFEKSKK